MIIKSNLTQIKLIIINIFIFLYFFPLILFFTWN